MKEVLQGNSGLRETIQRQSELIDEQNSEIWLLQNENDDLRERVLVLEELTGKEGKEEIEKLLKDKRILQKRVVELETTSNNWMVHAQQQRKTF